MEAHAPRIVLTRCMHMLRKDDTRFLMGQTCQSSKGAYLRGREVSATSFLAASTLLLTTADKARGDAMAGSELDLIRSE